ncbi:hypothetical protein [Bacteroides caecimuris]|uniref:hypothetical protein n=1 Tax=Bacteroides caecimuris TaxID=1796613 RepID=UPI0026E544B7|nr:hypothetical protein [Bacteroides caecimuris]
MREEYSIQIELMSYDEIHVHLQESSEDFSLRTEQFLNDYAHKLATNAEFVTLRSKDDRLMGVVAFYGNVHPFAYVTHVWVANFLRGGGIVEKCLNGVWRNVESDVLKLSA